MRRRHFVRDWLGITCLGVCLLLLGQAPAELPAQGQPRATLSPEELTAQVPTLTAVALLTPTATATATPTATCAPGPQCVYLTNLEGLPPATPTLVPSTPVPTRDPLRCHPSYPTVCIPPPPPNLSCLGIVHRNFVVLPPDPHGFDGDDDGIGCET